MMCSLASRRVLFADLFKGISVALGLFPTVAFGQDCPETLQAEFSDRPSSTFFPKFVDLDTGWILGNQNAEVMEPLSGDTLILLEELVHQLQEVRQTRLVFVIAPPRGLFAEGAFIELYDRRSLEVSYLALLDQLGTTGAIVVNPLSEARAAEANGDPFFFQRDTHWTSEGAYVTAESVARAISGAGVAQGNGRWEFVRERQTQRRVSDLAEIVREVCGIEFAPETLTIRLASNMSGSEDDISSGLFGETSVQYGLIGTSFSSEDLGFASSLSVALQDEVVNYSIGGGGLSSAFKSFAWNMKSSDWPHTLIWESPSRYWLADNESLIREIIGNVLTGCGDSDFTRTTEAVLGEDGVVNGPEAMYLQDTLELEVTGVSLDQLTIETYFGSDVRRLRLRHSDRLPIEYPRGKAWAYIGGADGANPDRIIVRGPTDLPNASITLKACPSDEIFR